MTLRMLARSFVLWLWGATSSCGWLLSAPDVHRHCYLEASTANACGRCLSSACQAAIDGCCGDETCSGVMDLVDGCASDGSEPCEAIVSSGHPLAAPLATCLTTNCAEACGLAESASTGAQGSAASSSTGMAVPQLSCSTSDDTCSCQLTTTSQVGNAVCNESSFGGASCCAHSQYPQKGSCRCTRARCERNFQTDTCRCASSIDGPNVGTACGVYTHCCQSKFGLGCACHSYVCADYDVEVDECTSQTLGCSSSEVEVSTCSGH